MRNFLKSLVQIIIFWCVSYFALLSISPKTALFPACVAALLLIVTAWLVRKKFPLINFLYQLSKIRLGVAFFSLSLPTINSNHIIENSWVFPMMFSLILLVEGIAMRIEQHIKP